ncbi:MAG: CRISPR-associated endonuclease Cas2 [Bacteroides sp.]|nr:CRISPR-associated endonuclease Cas2 [Prevotella sp.]MCM1407401.1 CRISPR-associated endonuclease Cas2 [Treponema brennaborense]MCM1469891.1 CRISPR-associated endonuclease Cas2 [Bacteroides sp.]
MFVSAVLDPGETDTARSLASLLVRYGFRKMQRSCWENPALPEKQLPFLKKDIDRVTDYYDSVRLYQYPVQGVMAVSELHRKKWKRFLLRPENR